MPESIKLQYGLLVQSNNLGFAYRFLREFGNKRIDSFTKAMLAKLSIPVFIDPDIGASYAVWLWALGFI